MSKIIAFRLTPKRERLIRYAQKKLKEKNISRIIESALEALVKEEDYQKKIERVKGSVSLPPDKDGLQIIRSMRGKE